MDPKEMKSALKSAREAIRKKEYKEALKHCKAILKHDKSHYNALVFVGVAAEGLEQADQALMAYKKAIEADPDQILAWQGLCGFYEKSSDPSTKKDLIPVYSKLANLVESEQKKLDYHVKLVELFLSDGNLDAAKTSLHSALALCPPGEEGHEKRRNLWTMMMESIQNEKPVAKEHQPLLRESMENLLALLDASDKYREPVQISYLDLLLEMDEDDSELLAKCKEAAVHHPDMSRPLEIMCEIHMDRALGHPSSDDLAAVADKLKSISPSSGLLTFVEGLQQLHTKDYSAAKQSFLQGMKSVGVNNISAWANLSKCYLKMHKTADALVSVQKAQKLLSEVSARFHSDRTSAERVLWVYEAQAFLNSSKSEGDCVQAIALAQKACEPVNAEALALITRGNIALGKIDAAREYLAQLQQMKDLPVETTILEAKILLAEGREWEAHDKLKAAIALDDCSAEAHLLLAKADKSSTFSHLLSAAKLDPFWSEPFLLLGNYYRDVMGDLIKAKRCYHKAYDLNPQDESCGTALVDTLNQLNEGEAALAVLKSATERAPSGSAKWAWMRLGLAQMKSEDSSLAINSLLAALQTDSKDRCCWECLGEAYLSRGSFSSALKAFTRALELDPSSTFSSYQIGNIRQCLGQYEEALADYESILSRDPSYVPALKGHGETHLFMARSALREAFHGRAVDHCQEALPSLTRAANKRPDLSCLWKLLGDACTMLFALPSELVNVDVPNRLLSSSNPEGSTRLNQRELSALGIRCYGMGIKQQPNLSSLWHDLGMAYWRHSLLMSSSATDRSQKKAFAGKSVQALQKAVSLQPTNHTHWNTLGVIAASDDVDHPALAQHAFIKSIHTETNNVEAWTNLGTLYLKKGQIELAHKAYKMAQSLEPSFAACWIGQALVAESIGHAEAMDLFRHTTGLDFHPESAIGYAQWVCNTLMNINHLTPDLYEYAINQMGAVITASDALAKYTDKIRNNPTAYNLYGLLLERQGLMGPAVQAFRQSIDLTEKYGPKQSLTEVHINFARALSAKGDYDAALEQYDKLHPLSDFDVASSYALCLFKAHKLESALKAYEHAASLAPSEGDQSHCYAAMGMTAFKMSQVELAKTSLFQGSQLQPPSELGLLALLGIGLLQRDATLAEAVLHEIPASMQNQATIRSLAASLAVVQGDVKHGMRQICAALHVRPDKTETWLKLSQFIMQNCPEMWPKAAHCIHLAAILDHKSMPDILMMASLTGLICGHHSMKNRSKNAFSLAQKAVHLYPDSLSSWCSLLACAHAEQVISSKDMGATTLAAHLMARVEHEMTHGPPGVDKVRLRSLHVWCVAQYVVALLTNAKIKEAEHFLQQATWLYEDNVYLQSLLAAITQNKAALKNIASLSGDPFVWQLLMKVYVDQNMMYEAESICKMWIKACQEVQKPNALAQLALLAYLQILKSHNDSDEKHWRELLAATAKEVLSQPAESSAKVVVQLMQGVIFMRDGNHKAAQKCLAYVLKHQDQMVLDSALQMAEVLSKKIKGDSEEPNEGQNKEGGKGKDWFNAD